jgi:hypothetical protein
LHAIELLGRGGCEGQLVDGLCVRGFYRVRKEEGREKVRKKEFIHARGKEQGKERKGKKRKGKDRQEQSTVQ